MFVSASVLQDNVEIYDHNSLFVDILDVEESLMRRAQKGVWALWILANPPLLVCVEDNKVPRLSPQEALEVSLIA